MNNEIYIILVNHSSSEDTIECLESILKQDYNNYQVIVIDNSKSVEHLNKIKKWSDGNYNEKIITEFPEIVYPLSKNPVSSALVTEDNFFNSKLKEKLLLVKAINNNGFAAANNIGLKYIKKFAEESSLIWLLNNDTIIEHDSVKNIHSQIQYYGDLKDKILFGTPLIEYYQPNKIQAIGGKYNRFFSLTSHVGEGLPINTKINIEEFNVDYPVGASIVISKKMLSEIGFMNEDYFLFFEELDWVLKLKKINGKIEILNIFGVYHKQGNSTKTKTINSKFKSEFIDLLYIKNRILFTRLYYKRYLISVIIFILTVTSAKRILAGNYKRAFKIYKLVLNQFF